MHIIELVLVHPLLIVLLLLFLLGFTFLFWSSFLFLLELLPDLLLGHSHSRYVIDLFIWIYLWDLGVLDILSDIVVPTNSHKPLELGPLVSERTDDKHTDTVLVVWGPVVEPADPIGVVGQIHRVA